MQMEISLDRGLSKLPWLCQPEGRHKAHMVFMKVAGANLSEGIGRRAA